MQNAELKAWAANKNFPGIEQALESQRNLETLLGADKAGRAVVVPKDENDAEGWKALGEKMGVPAKAADYKLPVPEGQDSAYAEIAQGWMKEANIAPAQAHKLAELQNKFVADLQAKSKAASEKATAELTAEWGPKAAENTEIARRGYRQFAEKLGITADPLVVESALGSANFLKFFMGLGGLNSESAFAGAGGNAAAAPSAGPGGSAQSALAEINKITDQRIAGTINDWDWKNTYEPKVRALEKIVTG